MKYSEYLSCLSEKATYSSHAANFSMVKLIFHDVDFAMFFGKVSGDQAEPISVPENPNLKINQYKKFLIRVKFPHENKIFKDNVTKKFPISFMTVGGSEKHHCSEYFYCNLKKLYCLFSYAERASQIKNYLE